MLTQGEVYKRGKGAAEGENEKNVFGRGKGAQLLWATCLRKKKKIGCLIILEVISDQKLAF